MIVVLVADLSLYLGLRFPFLDSQLIVHLAVLGSAADEAKGLDVMLEISREMTLR